MKGIKKLKNIAIIPARGGSKRIPRKNIKNFLGKPIIAYSIEVALKSGLFDEVMVSTDDEEIAEIAKRYGAKVPFLRSEKNSDDFATTAVVLEEVLSEYKNTLGLEFDYFCCIYPTAPLITAKKLNEAFEIMNHKNLDALFPVVKFSYPIQRALKLENNKISMISPENIAKRSQDLIPAFHDAGQFYFMKTNLFLLKKEIFTDNTGSVEFSALEVQDIDNETDWKIAEMKYKLMKIE